MGKVDKTKADSKSEKSEIPPQNPLLVADTKGKEIDLAQIFA